MNPSGTNYSWSNTAQWSQVPNSTPTNDQYAQPINNTANNYQNTMPQNQVMQAPTESRSDMINRLYKSILGREADTAGLNYYLYNTHISELQIARDMFESTEHADVLQKAKDIREMVAKTEESTKRMADMEYTLQSLQTLNENYKNLIDQKTQVINELRAKLNLGNDVQTNEVSHQPVHYNHQEYQPPFQPYNESNQTPDFNLLNDPFENDYSDRKPGCIGWLRSWFKFN